MKMPAPPPPIDLGVRLAQPDAQEFMRRASGVLVSAIADRYLPWDELRNRHPPDGLTTEEWWLALKLARTGMKRRLPLTDAEGRQFTYALPDAALRGIEVVDKHASGRTEVPAPVLPEAPVRDRYVISSLIEEAITSSQLEGALTTRKVAKEMLRTGRKPRTKDELMIFNNYLGMLRVREVRDVPLSPALICELHSIITQGTLEDSLCGRAQLPGEDRVVVADSHGEVFHVPPSADQLPGRLERLCDFANAYSDTSYVPPVVRAILAHFMLAYDHPFADGNGRTARLLFYWSMLNQDYWLTEFLPISRLLKKAPVQYARSFLYSEQDEGDLTYFVLYQLKILQRAITDLHEYLGRKTAEDRHLRGTLKSMAGTFNHRQLALLENALKNPDASYTVTSHARSHAVASQTARTDLRGLEQRGLLSRIRSGRGYGWTPAEDLGGLLKRDIN